MTASIAFVGAGPTTLYALHALLSQGDLPARITVIEARGAAGSGSPYSAEWNDRAMLSNIASVEIPPVTQTLADWLAARTPAELLALDIDPAALDERSFVPRLALGRYFEDQFAALVERARAAGVSIQVMTDCRVVDAANTPEGIELTYVSPPSLRASKAVFDHVVLATGHQWPSRQQGRPGYYLSPWPASALSKIPATDIGIRGSSLTAIDAAVALAGSHGAFVRQADRLVYEPAPDTEAFRLTMMSRKGILPEADFYFPLPHAPLDICTPEAVAALIVQETGGLLNAVFDLFRRELIQADPAYAAETGLGEGTLETFAQAYFARRAASDPFVWAAANLDEARANHTARVTVAWRDAILRMHEVVAAIVPHLDAAQFERFSRVFKPIFVDVYAGVPHESIERMLALHESGKLDVLALGEDHAVDTQSPERGADVTIAGRTRHFPVFIEATGQQALAAIQFPFLSLLEQGIVRDEVANDAPDVVRGIAVDELFRPVDAPLPPDRLFCLTLPFLMGRHPFAQGITSSFEMGGIVGRRLALVVKGEENPPHPAASAA
ncbi:FAD/NAD(P)-binding protein [Brevundimonas vesicularis]|uniref:FAD-dependent oxidoreductase n=1 Tax=Brevundimonas vesicularis TaxID=41276 RepID=A0A1Z3U6U2_BREVE|nr:FAD/NAD(P)-binding protein [Brevundimonas vesicularis]ASE38981.1 FAD-dependent oxidoreductase [Brevundimonas vesicularis]MDX2336355.1 FAD/NAD(P)-binding protein [Brevundimonas vesicularis]